MIKLVSWRIESWGVANEVLTDYYTNWAGSGCNQSQRVAWAPGYSKWSFVVRVPCLLVDDIPTQRIVSSRVAEGRAVDIQPLGHELPSLHLGIAT